MDTPLQLALKTKVTKVACGELFSLFLTSEGKVFAAGNHLQGRLGTLRLTSAGSCVATPVQVAFPEDVVIKVSEKNAFVCCAFDKVS